MLNRFQVKSVKSSLTIYVKTNYCQLKKKLVKNAPNFTFFYLSTLQFYNKCSFLQVHKCYASYLYTDIKVPFPLNFIKLWYQTLIASISKQDIKVNCTFKCSRIQRVCNFSSVVSIKRRGTKL